MDFSAAVVDGASGTTIYEYKHLAARSNKMDIKPGTSDIARRSGQILIPAVISPCNIYILNSRQIYLVMRQDS